MFMLRSTHDALMAQRLADLDYWRAEALAALARERAMMAKALEEAQKPAPPPPPRVKREPDEVDTAIDWKAQGDAAIRRHLERFAKAERRRGVEPKEIAAAIMVGDRRSDEDEDGIP